MAWDIQTTSSEVVLWNILLMVEIALVIFFLIKRGRKHVESLGLLWLLIGFIPIILACFSRPHFGLTLQPYWMAYASAGYFLIISSLLARLKNLISQKLWAMIVLVLITFYVAQSQFYNLIWDNQKKYCAYWLKHSFNSFWPDFWLGHTYMNEGNFEQARIHFQRTITHNNADFNAYGNLGVAEFKLGNLEKAHLYLNKALSLSPDSAYTYYWLGCLALEQRHLKDAKEYFLQALSLDKTLLVAQKKLSTIDLENSKCALPGAQKIREDF